MFTYMANQWSFQICFNVFICLVILCILNDLAVAQTVDVSYRVSTGEEGPIIIVSCEVGPPKGSTDNVVMWKFMGQRLSEDTQLKEADPSRFNVSDNGYRLEIRNALKEDEGTYTCNYSYTFRSDRHSVEGSSNVPVASYLPPLDYPQCSIEPSTTSVGMDVTFICQPGDAAPAVSLQLTLKKQNGEEVQLGHATSNMRVVAEDNNGVFLCIMSSDTFKTVQRNCSAGPITVVPTTPPTTTSPPTTPMKTTTAATTMSTTAKKSTTEKSATTNPIPSPEIGETTSSERSGVTPINTTPGIYTSKPLSSLKAHTYTSFSTMQATREASDTMPWSIIGGAAGAALVILIIIIIVLVFVKQRLSKGSRKPNERSQDINEMTDVRKGNALDSAYSSEVIGNGAQFDQPSTSADQNSNDDDNCDVKPVYGVVNKSNKVNRGISKSKPVYAAVDKTSKSSHRHEDEMPVYESTEIEAAQSNKPAASSDLPVYGKVNKGFKKDPKDESSKRESSGFVDNIIYTPSGPFVNQK